MDKKKSAAQRTALVTGGMGGIGTAICTRLGKSGVRIVAGCLPGYEKKDQWLDQMQSLGIVAHAAEGQVDDYESCVRMVGAIREEVGEIDILINNAGITRDSFLKKMSPVDWYAVINTNMNSVFNVTRQVIEGMAGRGWGRVINMSSVNAIKGQFGQTNYSAAKAGMHGFTKALAQEVVRKGVTVNTISPGYVETDMTRAIKPEILQSIVDQIPIGRMARPDEIAGLIAYLVSDDAAYITGANMSINGGLHMM
ncbi:MAG: acetoacetyl-CoA reductase [Burkholderiales bacterium]